MTDREKDYIIAKAIRQVCDPENPTFRWWDVPKYNFHTGAILSYIGKHPQSVFAKKFKEFSDRLLYPAIQWGSWELTPGVIKEIAFRAATSMEALDHSLR